MLTLGPVKSLRERFDERTTKAKQKAAREGQLYDAYPEREYNPVQVLFIRQGRFFERVDLDGESVDARDWLAHDWLRKVLANRVQIASQTLKERVRADHAEKLARREARRKAASGERAK
ncbi:MAG TPA: hypothetical protein VJP59_00180 [Gemmatimonadota bacterium]|nr:hypothetical protein [Gemmatimonadota bacterium]